MADDERIALAGWLASPDAGVALAAARQAVAQSPRDPLAAGTALRRQLPDLPPAHAAAVLEQAGLSQLAADRYGVHEPVLLTRDGLEAATRPEVARRRARLLVAAGAARVLDLTGGLGFDSAAFAAAGLAVTAVERDPVTAALLAANVPSARVVTADAVADDVLPALLAELGPDDVVFVDPARRDPAGPRDRATGRARPERDPERWSPPWSAVAGIPHPRIAAKVAPGFTPPADWTAEWISVDRSIVECAVYSWPVADASRRAVVLGRGTTTVVAADGTPAPPAATLEAWLHEPDPAVLRAGALGALARHEGLRAVDPDSTWLTGPRSCDSPAVRSHLLMAELVGSTRQQRRQLADLGVRRLTVKSRDVDADPRTVLRSLDVAEGPDAVLVLTRRTGRQVALLAQPALARSGP